MPTAGLRRSFGGLVTASSLRAHDCASLTNAEGPPPGDQGRASAATVPTRPRTTGPFLGAGALLCRQSGYARPLRSGCRAEANGRLRVRLGWLHLRHAEAGLSAAIQQALCRRMKPVPGH